MTRWKQWSLGTAAVMIAASMALGATAEDKAAVVKARQDFMKAQGADTKAINDYAKGMASKADAEKAIADLEARNSKILDQLVPGTSMADMPGVSYAKPAAFSDKDKLAAIVASLKTLEDKTAETIKTGTPEQVGAAAADIGRQGCVACHRDYRERKPT
jgi:cytochrome c556